MSTSVFSPFTDNDMNEVAKLRGFSSMEEQLIDDILNKGISWITTHDYHLSHPNCIQWSNQNTICCIHGPFITIIDIKLLYHGRPLDTVQHECRNDILSGLQGALSHIHCVPHLHSNNLDLNQAKKLKKHNQHNTRYNTSTTSSSSSSSSCLDAICSISTPIYINARWAPYPPSFFIQFGLLAVVQSNHIVNIYGIPCFTYYHMSNTVIPAQWTAIINLTKYLQPLTLTNHSQRFTPFLNENKIILHATCVTWLDHNDCNDIQYLMIGTREGFFVLFKFTFKYHPSLHDTKSNSVSPQIDNNHNNHNMNGSNNNNVQREFGFDIEKLNEFHCLNGMNIQNKKTTNKQNVKMNDFDNCFVDLVITQTESIQFKEDIFVAIALENGLCQIWKNSADNFEIFECVKQMDLQNNGSISCLEWFKLKTDEHCVYLSISKQRLIYILEIRIPHKRLQFKQYSSSNWMNNKTAIFFPKMSISGMQFINIGDETVIITSSYDGSIHGWNVPNCKPITPSIINNDNDDNDDNKYDDNIYNKLIIDICNKLCNKLETEIKQISKVLNLPPKRMSSFGIAADPNGLLLGLIHPVPKESKTRLSQGLQKLHLYPVSVDYKTVYNILFKQQQSINDQQYLYPTSIAITMDYFIPYHLYIIQDFINYYQNTFGHWFIVRNDDDEDEDDDDEDVDIDNNELNIDEILKNENSLRFCLLMMRYFVSRIEAFDGMHNNSKLQWLDLHIPDIMETLLQIHCYKTFKRFLSITNDKFKVCDDETVKEQQYLSIYLMFVWTLFSYISNTNKDHISEIFNFLHEKLLFELEHIFKRLNDNNLYEKCHRVHRLLYYDESDDEDEDNNDDKTGWTMNCKKIEHCPICNKSTSVVMHNGPCGSDGDSERHLISRCCVSFKIINNYNQLYCSCCNGLCTANMMKQLMMKQNTNNIMIQCFDHCKPFICSICRVPLVQLL